MTDLQARLVAAIQQVRTSEPHDAHCAALVDPHSGDDDDFVMRLASRGPCDCSWAARVDARLAACVEAMLVAANQEPPAGWIGPNPFTRGLAAFLAAAAQKETTK